MGTKHTEPARELPVLGEYDVVCGDQCGRDTPDRNIREMVNVVEEFGVYPLNFMEIDREIANLTT